MARPILKNYVLRTVKEAAKDYSGTRRERLKGALRDAAQGTESGWWNDLIYTSDVIDMANRYRVSVGNVIEAVAAEIGPRSTEMDGLTWDAIAQATAHRTSWDAYQGRKGDAAQRHALALTLALRIAVEALVYEVAADLEIQL